MILSVNELVHSLSGHLFGWSLNAGIEVKRTTAIGLLDIINLDANAFRLLVRAGTFFTARATFADTL